MCVRWRDDGAMRSGLLLLAALAMASQPTAAQEKYRPSGRTPGGAELVAVYVSSTFCIGSRAEGLHEAVEKVKLILSERASEGGVGFRAVGVALDWHTDSGKAYLDEFGAWDEIAVGSNWFGMGPEILIWGDTSARSSIPQLVVYEHDVFPAGSEVTFTPRRYLKRVYGADAIVTWVRDGAQIEP